ncbi:MAG: hypothetical protein PHD09_06580 [Candidatus Omnitrophica bacterium]|nr:hypothetical protein [Candidatus Omnitrophota bacterium]
MKVVHYTKPYFNLHPIQITNGDGKTGLFIKPNGGLWCSPFESVNGWVDWCRSESFRDIDSQQRVILEVDTTHFVTIDNAEDMECKLPWFQIHDMFWAIDFEKMVEQGIEGIHLTVKGQAKTRWTNPKNLYGWDCETVLIMNEKCINSVEI